MYRQSVIDLEPCRDRNLLLMQSNKPARRAHSSQLKNNTKGERKTMEKTRMTDGDLEQASGGISIPVFVQAGDTVASIAKKFGITPEQLIQTNELQDPNNLTVGTKLNLKF